MATSKVEHFEPRFWGLDPVFCARVKLNIIDVISLQSHPNLPEVYCILNHPVQSVQIMGDVVSVLKKSRLVEYKVDDGTGVIGCTQWRVVEDSDEGMVIPLLGQLVSVWGKVAEFRGEKQLTVTTMVEQNNPNAEPLHWLEVVHLKKMVYSRPFVLPRGVLVSAGIPPGGEESHRHVLQCTVTSFLENMCPGKHFTLKGLAADTALLKACKERRELADRTEKEMMGELESVIQELPPMGAIIPALGVGHRDKETKYEVFQMRKHLCPVILGFVQRKEQQRANAARMGVPESWIAQFIKQKDAFHLLPPHLVVEGIDMLVGDSLIYDYGNKNYRTVK